MKQILTFALLLAFSALFSACATTSASEVGLNQVDEIPSALCLRQSTVTLEAAGSSIGGVSIGRGYVITDAYAPILRNGRIVMVSADNGGMEPQRAEIVQIDQGTGVALLRVATSPACGAVLADMRGVAAGDVADIHSSVNGAGSAGQVLHPFHPFTEPGHLNDVMYLSSGMRKVPRGAGIYSAKGTLIGMRFGSPNEADVTAIPADRIARFLEARSVKYQQVNDGLTIKTAE